MKASLILINACVKMENPHVLKFQQFIFMALRPFPTLFQEIACFAERRPKTFCIRCLFFIVAAEAFFLVSVGNKNILL